MSRARAPRWSRRRGEPLDAGLRGRAEHSLGADLGDVRIRRNSSELTSPSVLGEAYGPDIHLSARASDPDSIFGQTVLAHELAHVAQQGERRGAPAVGQRVEDDADRSAAHVVGAWHGRGGARRVPTRSGGLALNRCTDPPARASDGVHYDEVVNNLYEGHPNHETLEAFSEFTMDSDPDREDVIANMTRMDAGGVYLFFGHGAQRRGNAGRSVGIAADDAAVMGQDIEDALGADQNPPTMVVLGGCATSDLENYVTNAGVPIAAGITENVSNVAGASAMTMFMRRLREGDTLGEARTAANEVINAGASMLTNPNMATFSVRYAEGYSPSLTLEQARRQHRGL